MGIKCRAPRFKRRTANVVRRVLGIRRRAEDVPQSSPNVCRVHNSRGTSVRGTSKGASKGGGIPAEGYRETSKGGEVDKYLSVPYNVRRVSEHVP